MANKRRPHRAQVRAAASRRLDKSARFASTSASPRFGSIFQPLAAVFHIHPSLSLLLRLLISAVLLALLLLMRSYAEAQEDTRFNHVGFPLVDPSDKLLNPSPSLPAFSGPPASNMWLLDQP